MPKPLSVTLQPSSNKPQRRYQIANHHHDQLNLRPRISVCWRHKRKNASSLLRTTKLHLLLRPRSLPFRLGTPEGKVHPDTPLQVSSKRISSPPRIPSGGRRTSNTLQPLPPLLPPLLRRLKHPSRLK